MIYLGLTGWPISHSLSPTIHGAALNAVGLAGEYSLYPVSPERPQELKDLLNRVRNGELRGLNVTVPHKESVIPLLDELTPSAMAIRAVNMIFMEKSRLIGHNTDAPGFLADLKKFCSPLEESKNVLVLGAGGSARAVVWALGSAGWRVTVAARKVEQAQILAGSIELETVNGLIEAVQLKTELLNFYLKGISLIVNTTPVGMAPKIEFSPWPAGLPFPDGAFVYDLVYIPRETRLVRQASAAGLCATTGLGMLIEQAALGFEIWTGKKAPRDVMFSSVLRGDIQEGYEMQNRTKVAR